MQSREMLQQVQLLWKLTGLLWPWQLHRSVSLQRLSSSCFGCLCSEYHLLLAVTFSAIYLPRESSVSMSLYIYLLFIGSYACNKYIYKQQIMCTHAPMRWCYPCLMLSCNITYNYYYKKKDWDSEQQCIGKSGRLAICMGDFLNRKKVNLEWNIAP